MRLQIVTLAAKLLVLSPGDATLSVLSRYVFSLARYDNNYDVRDRAKMISSLLAGISPSLVDGSQEERSGVVLRKEQVHVVLFDGKSGVIDDEPNYAGMFIRSYDKAYGSIPLLQLTRNLFSDP